jgi:hypothetical protein
MQKSQRDGAGQREFNVFPPFITPSQTNTTARVLLVVAGALCAGDTMF